MINRVNKAVERFLSARHYTDIQKVDFPPFNYFAYDEDEAVLIHAAMTENGFDIELDRGEAEMAMINAVVSGLIGIDKRIRFDTISVLVVEEDKALIRHHLNSLR